MTHIQDDKLFSCANRAKGKVVLITGGACGIGREAALSFASHGSKVVIGDLNETGAAELVEEIEGSGGTATFMKCNVCVWDDLVALFELAMSLYHSVDIIVPSAGVTDTGEFEHVEIKDGKPVQPKLTTIDVNLTAVINTVYLSQHYLCLNKKEGDLKSIVLIGSVASWVAVPKADMYTASKHAILGLMRALHQSLDLQGIRIACIHPFFADTNILPVAAKLFLAGIPMLPVPRIAGAIFYAATDPTPETNGSAWLLPDDGPVFLVPKEEFKMGVYKMIDERRNALYVGAKGFQYYAGIVKDVIRYTRPVSTVALFVLVGVIVGTKQEQLTDHANHYLSKYT